MFLSKNILKINIRNFTDRILQFIMQNNSFKERVSMRLLIIGDTVSTWFVQFIEHCTREQDEIYIFDTGYQRGIYSVYNRTNIKIVEFAPEDRALFGKRFYKRKPCARKKIVEKYANMLSEYDPFDIINAQFVSYLGAWLACRLKNSNTKLVLSFWGSDLLRNSFRGLYRLRKYICMTDLVTFDNLDLQERFHQVYGKIYKGKQECAYFGVSILDEIDTLHRQLTKQELREEMGIPQNCCCVAVGYNGGIPQQHIKVLESVERLPKEQKDSIYILLQMTYGGTDGYKKSVIEKIKSMNLPYKLFLEFLPEREVAKIRIVTDVYINAQTTDAFSGSVCENLYCGNAVINAEWLMYRELKDKDIHCLTFSGFDELSEILRKYLAGDVLIDTKGNKEKIADLRSWRECGKRWMSLLYHEN